MSQVSEQSLAESAQLFAYETLEDAVLTERIAKVRRDMGSKLLILGQPLSAGRGDCPFRPARRQLPN